MTRTLKQKGRAIVAAKKRDLRGEAVLDGVKPRAGWWLVHRGRERVYGRILRSRRDGSIDIRTPEHPCVRIKGRTLVDGGYSYTEHARLEGVLAQD